MKHVFIIWLLACCCVLTAASCKKEKSTPEKERAKLPPITQTGARTFGCLVNGKALLPKGPPGHSGWQCNYQQINLEYYFYLRGSNDSHKDYLTSISILTQKLKISEGQTLKLAEHRIAGKASAFYEVYYREGPIDSYETNVDIIGELHISRLDLARQIVSGTFWFDAVNEKGEKVEVREGRFDLPFTF